MLLHLYTGILPWDKLIFEHHLSKNKIKNDTVDTDSPFLYYVMPKQDIYFNSESHKNFYNLKKNTNYEEFYKSINKYDGQVETLIGLYNDL